MNLDFISVFGLIACAHGFFLATAFLFARDTQVQVRVIISILLAILSFNVLHDILIQSGYLVEFPHFLYMGETFNFLIWPLVFFYVKLYLGKKFSRVDLLHLIPFLVFNAFRLHLYFTPGDVKVIVIESFFEVNDHATLISRDWGLSSFGYDFLIWRLQGLVYILIMYAFFKVKNRLTVYSNRSWVLLVIVGFAVIWLVKYAVFLVPYFYPVPITISNTVEILLNAAYILLISFLAIKMPHKEPNRSKYESSSLDGDLVKSITNKLIETIEEKRIFLDPGLTLERLAKEIKTNPKYLSQVINERYQKNFSDFINTYRVAETRRKLGDIEYSSLKLEVIARDSGFNSVTTCNRAFKKITGNTASHYRRN